MKLGAVWMLLLGVSLKPNKQKHLHHKVEISMFHFKITTSSANNYWTSTHQFYIIFQKSMTISEV